MSNEREVTYRELAVTELVPTKDNPRRLRESSQSFIELRESVKAVGVKVPVHVRNHPEREGKLEILAGERRWKAACLEGLKTIPALDHADLGDEEAFEITFIENWCREDLSPIEEGRAAELLLEKLGGDYEAAAAKLKVSADTLRRRVRIMKLMPEWQAWFEAEESKIADWTTAHLELIARYDETQQLAILKDLEASYWVTGATVKTLRRYLDDRMRSIARAPWPLDDGRIVRTAGACNLCLKRSSCNPALFVLDDEPSEISESDRCTDPQCWDKKLKAWIKRRVKELSAEHENLIKISTSFGSRGSHTLGPYQYYKATERSKGAVPAVVVQGETDLGELLWVKPHGTAAQGNKKEEPKKNARELAEEAIKRDRENYITEKFEALINATANQKKTMGADPLPTPPVAKVIALLHAYGLQAPYADDPVKRLKAAVKLPTSGKKFADAIWPGVANCMAEAMRDVELPEIKAVSELAGIDYKALEKEAQAKYPDLEKGN